MAWVFPTTSRDAEVKCSRSFSKRPGGDVEPVNRNAVALIYIALGQIVVAAPRTVPVDFRELLLTVVEVRLEGALGAIRRILASVVTPFILVLAGDFLALRTLGFVTWAV